MPSYWILTVLAALMLTGLNDAWRIQRLEAQNAELLSRLTRLERVRPNLPRESEGDCGDERPDDESA